MGGVCRGQVGQSIRVKPPAKPDVAVLLTTCGRLDYTTRTLESLSAHNDLTRFQLFHADDASGQPEILRVVKQYGFRTIFRTKKTRLGGAGHPLRAHAIRRMGNRGVRWVLVLENDIESVRPFPWDAFALVRRDPSIYCLRLYGRFKDADGKEPCKTTHQWKADLDVTWKPIKKAPEPMELAQIHWSAQPSVTRFHELAALYLGDKREMKLRTVRVVHNVMVHIGKERTKSI